MEVDRVQNQLAEEGFTDELYIQEQKAQLDLHRALSYQEQFWKEKAKINWHTHGDRNTAYFHRVAKIRNASKRITVLRNGDSILDYDSALEQHVLQFYSSLYAIDNNCVDNNNIIDNSIPYIISDQDNIMLTNLPSLEEIKEADLSMCGSSAPDPDGSGGCFYKHFWNKVGSDVCKSVLQFFYQNWLLPNLNSNLVVLVPKYPGADKIESFRPIALANFNFQFKIISKILADRLAIVASKIISVQQRGFIRGRHITDCICTAS